MNESVWRCEHEKYKNEKFPKIVSVGGGTGLSVLLRCLKSKTPNVTAVVTVADDGGGSGMLRDDLNMLPPGDIRNCILALAETEPVMEKLLRYRFCDGTLKGQSFGNLFIAAMTGISDGNFVEAVQRVSEVLKVSGCVLPVTDANVELAATLENGMHVSGESLIGHSTHIYGSKISGVELKVKGDVDRKEKIRALPQVLDAIAEADLITLGPGSLYTSIVPNLIVSGVADAIHKAKAPVVYINNIMTQPGETDGYNARNHYDAILAHTCPDFIDYCIVNTGRIADSIAERYRSEGAAAVEYTREMFDGVKSKIIEANLADVGADSKVRHNSAYLADMLIETVRGERNGK